VKLKNLAASKIHRVSSTAKGEIAYARYVYQYTPKDDTTIRAPIANFWAMRSHTLRAEAEEEFKSLCLEFPQFGYDVLSKLSLLVAEAVVVLTGVQHGFWTRSSSERRTRRCTPLLAARGRGRGTAKSRLESRGCGADIYELRALNVE
jgi:hypothetical protein